MKAAASLSDRARSGLDDDLVHAVRGALAADGAPFVMQATDALDAQASDIVMLTVSSYRFRVLVFVHFDRSAATRAHIAALAGVPVDEMDDARFLDAMMERGNLCCGALNRDLAVFYPHIGMSTPCLLRGHSVEHIRALQPDHTRCFRVDLGGDVVMHVNLALCTFEDFDFAYEPRPAEVAETAGELEMF